MQFAVWSSRIFCGQQNRSEDVRGKEFQRRMRAVVIDEAHLVLQWYLYILFQKLFYNVVDLSSFISLIKASE